MDNLASVSATKESSARGGKHGQVRGLFSSGSGIRSVVIFAYVSVFYAVFAFAFVFGSGYAMAMQESVLPAETTIIADTTGSEFIVETHVVQRGENLSSISVLYGISINRLAALNRLISPDFIVAGQRLIVSERIPYVSPADRAYEASSVSHQNYLLHLYEQNIDQAVYSALDRFIDTDRLFVDTRITARLVSNFELAVSGFEAAGSGEETRMPAIASVPSYLYRDAAGRNGGAHMVIGTEAGQQLDIERIAVHVFMEEEPEEEVQEFLERLIVSAARLNSERGDFINFEFIRFPTVPLVSSEAGSAAAVTNGYTSYNNNKNNNHDAASAYGDMQNGDTTTPTLTLPGVLAVVAILFFILIWFLFRASGNKN